MLIFPVTFLIKSGISPTHRPKQPMEKIECRSQCEDQLDIKAVYRKDTSAGRDLPTSLTAAFSPWEPCGGRGGQTPTLTSTCILWQMVIPRTHTQKIHIKKFKVICKN